MTKRIFSVAAAALLAVAAAVVAIAPPAAAATPGDLDTSFGGGDGTVRTAFATAAGANAVAVAPDGKIVAAGVHPGTTVTSVVVRYLASGAVDAKFAGGQLWTPGRHIRDLAVDGAGRVVLVGSRPVLTSSSTRVPQVWIARLTAAGAFDPAFAGDGQIELPNLGEAEAVSVASAPGGKVVVGIAGGSDGFRTVRYLSNGALDSGYGASGVATLDFGGTDDRLADLAVFADSRVVVVGEGRSAATDDAGEYFTQAKLGLLTASGQPDPSYSTDGREAIGEGRLTSVTIVPGAGFVAAGSWHWTSSYPCSPCIGSHSPALIARTMSGAARPGFTSPYDPNDVFGVVDVAAQADGRLLVVTGPHTAFGVTRLTRSGEIDTSFGGGDGQTTHAVDGEGGRPKRVVIQLDGRPVVAGNAGSGGSAFGLARYHEELPKATVRFAFPRAEGGAAQFQILLDKPSFQTIAVRVATESGTATAPADYQAIAATVTVPAGTSSRTVAVPTVDDALDEGDESLRVRLSSPTNALLGAAVVASGTIVDNDPLPTVWVDAGAASEGDAGTRPVAVRVKLDRPSGRTVSVSWALIDDTATAPADYAAASGTVRFSAGQVEKLLYVQVVGDTVREPDEMLKVRLSNPVNAIFPRGLTTFTDHLGITNDDIPRVVIDDVSVAEGDGGTDAVFAVRLTMPSEQAVSVTVATSDGTAGAAIDYDATRGTVNFPAGTTNMRFRVPLIGDDTVESAETFFLDVIGASGAPVADGRGMATIADDD